MSLQKNIYGDINLDKEELGHLLKYAKNYAENGDVDYAIQCLDEADFCANMMGYVIDKDKKNDIKRTAYRRGVRKIVEYAKCHLDDKEILRECKNYAEKYSRDILDCQRSVKEIRSSRYISKPFDELRIRLKYGKISDEDLQKEFDKSGKIYDLQTLLDSKIMKKRIESIEKPFNESKITKISRFFSKISNWFRKK